MIKLAIAPDKAFTRIDAASCIRREAVFEEFTREVHRSRSQERQLETYLGGFPMRTHFQVR
jgi:hypothetical protein